MTRRATLVAGAATAVGVRMALRQALLAKFRRDIEQLNAGKYERLLAAYDDDAVLRFHDGHHRWAGTHRGKAGIGTVLHNMTRAGLQGELRDLWLGGPPWALTLVARFDDRAQGPDGELLYRNRAVLVVRTRWGRIVEQDDFFEDTGRIEEFEARLRELGVAPVGVDLPTGR